MMKYTIVLRGKNFTNFIENLTEEEKNNLIRMLAKPLFSSFNYDVLRIYDEVE